MRRKLRSEDLLRGLKDLLDIKPLIRVIEVHNGASTLVANNARAELEVDGKKKLLEFDALWASGFTDSASRGLPDIEIASPDSRLLKIDEIMNVTNKPLIVDGDTGGEIAGFEYLVNRLERLGASAVVIEDKIFPKRNSLDPDSAQNLAEPNAFADKVEAGKQAACSRDFMIFARIESLIAGCGIEDALSRAEKYLCARADGIVVHSNDSNPVRVLKFAQEYFKLCRKLGFCKPLICIPTTYDTIREEELMKYGFRVVIYANHLLRASVKAMQDICQMILLNGRAFETEPYCTPVSKIFEMVGFTEIRERDRIRSLGQSLANVIIPAAGAPRELIVQGIPTAMLEVNGKTIIQRQLDVLKRSDVTNIAVIRGYEKEKINVRNVIYYDVEDFRKGSLYSLFTAREKMDKGFILIFSDILFDQSVIERVLKSKGDIVVVADASYSLHQHEIDKELDLIIGKQESEYLRELSTVIEKEVSFIGKKIRKEIATHEFIGIAKFSEYGARSFVEVYEDCSKYQRRKFHESEDFDRASIVDLLQEMIDRGFKIHYIETNKGWMEIHNKKDYEIAKRMIY